MRKCKKRILCSECPSRATCPATVRRDKRARRPMAESASNALVRRAASVLEGGWHTCESLGRALYGEPRAGRSGRMSVMVRARRTVNRLLRLGLLAVRESASGNGAAEYTLLQEGKEVLP